MRSPVVRFDHAPRNEKATFCDHCETCIYAQRQVIFSERIFHSPSITIITVFLALTQSRTMRTFIPLLALPVSLAASIVGRAAISYDAQSGTKSSQIDAAPVGIR
jgi:phosphate/sulfate permease